MLALKYCETQTQILKTLETDFLGEVVDEFQINEEVYQFFWDFEAEGARVRRGDGFGFV